MTRSILASLAVLTGTTLGLPATGLAASAVPEFQQFLKIQVPRFPNLLPDGSLLMIDRPEGVFQLYRVTPKDPTAPDALHPDRSTAEKLTDFPDGVHRYSLSPDGKRVVLMHARGGNENTQLTLLDLATLETSPILANPRVQASVNHWLHDGSGFFYSANDESPDDFHLYRWDFATQKATKLLGRAGSWSVDDVTRDGRRVLVSRRVSVSASECYELDVAGGAVTEITVRPASSTASCEVVGYLADERAVLIVSDQEQGRQRLYRREIRSGKVTPLLPELARFELDRAALNEDRDLLVVVTNEDGYGVPYVYALPGFVRLPSVTQVKGVFTSSAFRGRRLVWALANSRTPGEAYVTEFSTGKNAAPRTRQVTWADRQGIDTRAFPMAELVRYPAFDGREIPAFLYLPPGAQRGTPVPFLIVYHGGPEGQHRPTFDAITQFYLTRGYGVLLPNVRGSTGYGREFHQLDDYKKRWDSVRDGVDAAEWLVATGYAEAGRIAAYGGSYGGFMSVACVVEDQERVDAGQRPKRLFGACVDVVGIVNLKTFLEKTSDYRRKLREVEYGPLSDPEFLASVSSIHRVDKIQVPVFIAHGFNDPRVPVQEAMQLAAALKEKGRNPRMFVAPDEGHGFAKMDNRIYFNERMAAFLEETIGRSVTAPAASR